MTLPSIISRNSVQVNTDQSVGGNSAIVGTAVVTLYTVPANKKAILKSAAARFVSGGANTNLDVVIGAQRVFRETAAPSPPVLQDIPNVKGMVLIAAQTIQLLGDSGSNNGSMNFFFTFTELPA